MLTYALRLADRYDGMVMATCPDVPEVLALGRDSEEARDEAVRALEAALETYAAEGRQFPLPRATGKISITTTRFGALATA
ncbi:MAG TPA: type II toxin-antitoxin system HicB family antitoxin [Allosphingosinicella sp.]|nr:type II toxin-antitoxin system HicB family antitoxin [Allosphingosinicella sp.]